MIEKAVMICSTVNLAVNRTSNLIDMSSDMSMGTQQGSQQQSRLPYGAHYSVLEQAC